MNQQRLFSCAILMLGVTAGCVARGSGELPSTRYPQEIVGSWTFVAGDEHYDRTQWQFGGNGHLTVTDEGDESYAFWWTEPGDDGRELCYRFGGGRHFMCSSYAISPASGAEPARLVLEGTTFDYTYRFEAVR